MELESGVGAAEERPVWRTRHAVPKRSRAFASHGEPNLKKVKKRSKAEASARMPEIILLVLRSRKRKKKKRRQF